MKAESGKFMWLEWCRRRVVQNDTIKFADSDGFCVENTQRYVYREAPGKVDPPYRNIVRCENCPNGENVELECGHGVHMIYHRIQRVECTECLKKEEE